MNGAVAKIVERELEKLEAASALPHALTAEQMEQLERLARVLKLAGPFEADAPAGPTGDVAAALELLKP